MAYHRLSYTVGKVLQIGEKRHITLQQIPIGSPFMNFQNYIPIKDDFSVLFDAKENIQKSVAQ